MFFVVFLSPNKRFSVFMRELMYLVVCANNISLIITRFLHTEEDDVVIITPICMHRGGITISDGDGGTRCTNHL